jgi:hypothetical protein
MVVAEILSFSRGKNIWFLVNSDPSPGSKVREVHPNMDTHEIMQKFFVCLPKEEMEGGNRNAFPEVALQLERR